MARRPRLSLPGIAQVVEQRGHNGGAIVRDAEDVEQLLQTLREAALGCGVVLHAYAVGGTQLQLLATPDRADGISRMMQTLGRRYAAGFNRRHGRTGALWDGRFRSALVGPGESTLAVIRLLDGETIPAEVTVPGLGDHPAALPKAVDALLRSSAAHRCGGRRDAALVDPPEYWQLGNTPFERESRYRALLAEPVAVAEAGALQRALRGGWALGSADFLAQLAQATARPLSPLPRGRPRRKA